MRRHHFPSAFLAALIPFLNFSAANAEVTTANAKDDMICRDAKPPYRIESFHLDSPEEKRSTLEHPSGSLEWWFESCHGVVVRQFCRPRNYFGQSKPGEESLDKRLNEEAIWLRVTGHGPITTLGQSKANEEDDEVHRSKVDEAYRFLWRPSFFSPPTVITVYRSNDTYSFYATQFCQGHDKARKLTKAE